MEKGEENMKFQVYYFFNETIKAINFYIDSKRYEIDVKRIRRYHNIEPSNKSKINFIFRNLQVLVDHQIIERYDRRKRQYSYKLPKERIELILREKGFVEFQSVPVKKNMVI